jgi:hypothetical protein
MPPKKSQQIKDSSTEFSDSLSDLSSDEKIQTKKLLPKKPTKIVKIETSNDDNTGFKIEEVKTIKYTDVTINNFNESTINTLIEMKDNNKMKLLYNKLLYQDEDEKLRFDPILWQKDSPNAISLKYQGKISIHLSSNKLLIKQLTKMSELKKAIQTFDRHEDKGYYKVLKFYDGNNSVLTITQGSPIDIFKRNILYRISDPEKSNLLSSFNNLDEIKLDVLGYHIGNYINFKIEDKKETNRIRDSYLDAEELKKKLEKNQTKKVENFTTNNIIYDVEFYKTILNKIISELDQEKLKLFKKSYYYIYKIQSKNKDDKTKNLYIFGSTKKFLSKDILSVINKFYLGFDEKSCLIIELEKLNIYFEVEGQLKVDEYIEKENAINCGSNLFFNVVLSNDNINNINDINEEKIITRLTLLLNDEIAFELTKNIKILNEDSNYIACIKTPNDFNYIFYEKKYTIQNVIHRLYNSINEDTKLMKVLSTTSFFDLKIIIIQDGISDDDIDIVYNQIMKRFNQSKLLNDNIINKQKDVDYKKIYFIQRNINKKRI